MRLTLAAVQVIADLCRVSAGDTHNYGSTVSEIIGSQRECHAFYAKCTDAGKSLTDCMSERQRLAEEKERQFQESLKKK